MLQKHVFLVIFFSSVFAFMPNEKLCSLKKSKDNCDGPKQMRWFFNSTHCEKFLHHGCAENGNNFESEEICLGTCGSTCKLPLEYGTCDLNLTRYYYSTTSNTCEKFTYHGCDKNGNHFEDVMSCWRTCQNACTLDVAPGMCSAQLDRYYFDISTGMCLLFKYSGCGANNNNFLTLEQCEKQCNLDVSLLSFK